MAPRPSLSVTNLRPVLYIVGYLLALLAAGMVVPALVDASLGNPDWVIFAACAAGTGFFAICLILAFHSSVPRITLRQGFLFTNLAWIATCLVAAVPFMFTTVHLGFMDAFFEAMSGITTTGATVITGLNDLPEGILLWRSLLNWLGGLGIVAMALIILPFLRVGGMQLFRTESSDRSEKIYGNARDMAEGLAITYLGLSVLCGASYMFAGMGVFDAICHAMASVATGGFSTKDKSLGHFDNVAIYWIATLFMFAGAMPLTWYTRIARHRRALWSESQPRAFAALLALFIGGMTGWTFAHVYPDFGTALTHAAFNVTSIVTTTGYTSTDFSLWGTFAVVGFFCFAFVGGCTGSTTGSIKIFRWQLLTRAVGNQMRRMLEPNRVIARSYDGRVVSDDVVQAVIGFFFAYIATFGVLAALMAALGNDFVTSLSGVAATMGGVGPGLGEVIGPAGTYKPLSDPSKAVLSLAMVLGRLELFTLYVLLTADFWRD